QSDPAALPVSRNLERLLYKVPWLRPDPQANLDQLALDEIAAPHDAVPPGVLIRHRATPAQPVAIPDLIGVADRRYLDRTGLQRNRGIADLMRYAAMNQGGDDLGTFGDFIPFAVLTGGQLPPDPSKLPPDQMDRYSDEQLYALTLYIYSLKSPPN